MICLNSPKSSELTKQW